MKTAATTRKAAEDNNFVIAMISDDGASRQVWREAEDGALGGMKVDVIAIESSTLTPTWALELASFMSETRLGAVSGWILEFRKPMDRAGCDLDRSAITDMSIAQGTRAD